MSQSPISEVCTALDEAVADGLAPGAVVACGGPQGQRYRHVTGQAARLPVPRPLREQTLFDLASLTKVLATTWLTMRWWETGRLDLDSPLGSLLPGYYPADKADLTVRQLLCHAAGFAAGLRLREQVDPTSPAPLSRRRWAIDQFLAAPLQTEPGTGTRYSDIGPILVADLLEQLGEQRLDEACTRDLYAPASLHDTLFVPLNGSHEAECRPAQAYAPTEACPWRQRIVVGEVHDENAWLLGGVAGHAGLFAPIADLERVARAFLGLEGDARVSPVTLATLTQPQQAAPDSSRALGWDTPSPGGPAGTRLSPRAFGHTGFTGTSLWIDPQQQLYVILLSNRVHPSRDNARMTAFRPGFHDLVVETLTRAS